MRYEPAEGSLPQRRRVFAALSLLPLLLSLAAALAPMHGVRADAAPDGAPEEPCRESRILGSIGAFAELVSVEVKELGLSPTLGYEQAQALHGRVLEIASDFGVQVYRERDLLVTDLFPHEVAVGKEVFLIFKADETLERYLALKKKHQALAADDRLDLERRADLAREFGRLLSYPDHVIDRMLDASAERAAAREARAERL